MRAKLYGFLIGCGLVAATAMPGLACPFNTEASNSQTQQQTAQAQTSTTTTSQ